MLFLTSCNRDPGAQAKAHFEAILGALEGGKLGEAYGRLIPESYDRELNEILSMTQGLLDEGEIQDLRRILEKTVRDVASTLAARAAKAPAEEARALDAISAKLEKIPSQLGMDDLVSFRSLDVASVLRAFEGVYAEILALAPLREKIASVGVRVDEARGQWVKLGFGTGPSEGGTEDKVEVILKEDRWIPSAWVIDWPREMAAMRARITTLADRKSREPRVVKDELASLDILLQGAAPAVDALLDRVGVPRG